MIRRAQAEALLKLAEALEECERNEITIQTTDYGLDLITEGSLNEDVWGHDVDATGADVRMAIAKLYPKSEAAE